ncbi:MAG TPA: tetratricopeptide repeat protein [Thermoanaerobaculia bacterium]|jgi:tetratricopeptide (TPR) repeat protein|nr:tetratricopeptide repeat protein [Thermoanaerobaculia bacterium]
MPRLPQVCAVVLLTASTAFAARLTFGRTIPARQNLAGAEDLVITYAISDTDKISTFLDVFLDQTNRSGTLRVLDATEEKTPARKRRLRRQVKEIPQHYRVEATLRINSFTCQTVEKSGQGSSFDVDGNRVRRKQLWIDAICESHIDALSKSSKKLAEFSVRGEGTSPRVEELTDEERDIALEQAARYAAIAAAEEITPRRIRESIVLADDAPEFDEGMAMIDAERLDGARRIWESALARHSNSAELHFNLAAVYEALGQLTTADLHYDAAKRLAPKDARFRYEHDMFRRRNGWRK